MTTIYIYANLKWNNRQQNHNTQIDNRVRHNFAYVSGPLSLWGRLLYFCSKSQKYISTMPNGYKTNLVMFFQISRTLQRKRHAKRTSGAPRNGPTTSPPQKLLYLKMALAWFPSRITLFWLLQWLQSTQKPLSGLFWHLNRSKNEEVRPPGSLPLQAWCLCIYKMHPLLTEPGSHAF